ncbi:pyruvate kinase [Paenibacillus sp. FSL R7-0198]|uniref:pyruvate kinase n=1 Tax=unclassified Paenibacillus TaxID=185978 RepID=UPI0030DB1281
MHINIQQLYERYLTLNIPNPFSLEQIHDHLTNKYHAEKVDLSLFSNLSSDPYADFDQAIAAYVFKDKRGIIELLKLNNEEEIYEPLEFAWIINSTIQGFSHMLCVEISVLQIEIPKEQMVLGNLLFEEYLVALYLTGHIFFENDQLIDKVIARYKEGYRLRYFGNQNGDDTYLCN